MNTDFTGMTRVRNTGIWYTKYKWCRENLAKDTWSFNLGDWYFVNPEDALLFKMRWS